MKLSHAEMVAQDDGAGAARAPWRPSTRSIAFLAVIDCEDAQALARLRETMPDGCLIDRGEGTARIGEIRELPLTGRQREILALMAQGLSNKQIGRDLGISHFTVRNHVSKLLQMLELPSRKVIRPNLVPTPDHSSATVHKLRDR